MQTKSGTYYDSMFPLVHYTIHSIIQRKVAIMNILVGDPKDGTSSKILMNPEQILAMTENSSSLQHEEGSTDQQGKTAKKKSIKKKKATKPGAVASKSAELSSKECEDSAQQSLSKSKKPGSTKNEPGVKKSAKKGSSKAKDSVKSQVKRSRSSQVVTPGAMAVVNEQEQVAESLALESSVSAGGSAPKRSSSKPGAFASTSKTEVSVKERQASRRRRSSRQSEPSRNASSKSARSASPPTYFPVENAPPPEAAREAAPGATRLEGIGATHQDGMDLEEGGSATIANVEVAEVSAPPHVEAQDGTVTATAIARDDLEQEVREKLFAEAVEAEVIKPFSSSAHKNRKWMILGCILLLLIIVGAVVGVVVATGDSGGAKSTENGSGSVNDNDSITNESTGGISDKGPTAAPTTPNSTEQGGLAMLDFLKSESPDGGVALSNLASPQYKAYLWILGETPETEQSEPPSPNQRGRILSRYGMATLYYSTGGEDWTQSENWLSTSHICTWYPSESTTCDTNQNVIELNLGDNNLIGTLPDELVFVSSLEGIDLRRNALTGSIPPKFSRLVKLKELELSENNLTNNLPSSFRLLSNLGKG
jgi:hypothetical protein